MALNSLPDDISRQCSINPKTQKKIETYLYFKWRLDVINILVLVL